MVVSIYRKNVELKWLDETFKRKEGFTTAACGGSSPTSTCDRLKYLTCNRYFSSIKSLLEKTTELNNLASKANELNNLVSDQNYSKLERLMNGIEINAADNSFNLNTSGGSIITSNISSDSDTGINVSSDINMKDKNIKFYDTNSQKLNELTIDGVLTYYLYVKDMRVNSSFGGGYNSDAYIYPTAFNGTHTRVNAINWSTSD